MTEATARPTIDRVSTFLRGRYGPRAGEVVPLGQGAWSTAFGCELDGEPVVVRFGALREDFDRDRLAAAYRSPALPIPAVLAIDEAFGGWFAVSERRFGTFLDDLDGPALGAVLPSLFATLDAARAIDLSATGGYGNWDAAGNGPFATWPDALRDVAAEQPGSRVAGWRRQLTRSEIGSRAFAMGYAEMDRLLAFAPVERHLIHSDLLNFNVLVDGDRISAVFDWGCVLTGDFLYDLAWFVFWAPWYPAWHGIDFAFAARRHYAEIGLDVPNFNKRLRCCQLHIGLSSLAYKSSIQQWDELERVARHVIDIS